MKYEYKSIKRPHVHVDASAFSILGEDGWEMVAAVSDKTGTTIYFKRYERTSV